MDFSAVYHRTADQYVYPLNDEELIINLRTGKEIDRVYMIQGDPYNAGIMGGNEEWSGERIEIYYKKRLKYHTWWTTTLTPRYRRLKYYFELHCGDEVMYYFEDGFYSKEDMERPGKQLAYFIYPWMNPADIFRTPKWVNETVWYQIFPERFCNGDESNDPEGVKPWKYEKINGYREYYGGDLRGIIDKLSYLVDLGINGIYLTPVFEADSNHKYNTRNYRKVDPEFGTNEELKELVSKAHNLGIRIMLDAVFNHTGTDFPMWEDVALKGKDSEYADWYMINKFPVEVSGDTKDARYFSFAFAEQMPKLNTNNPKVREYLKDIVGFWMDEFDIDGLRFDVGNEISHKLLKELRDMTKERKEDFYLLGEIWHDSMEWLRGDEYDAVMNYPLSTAISNYWVFDNWDKSEFEYAINQSFTTYMQQTNDVLFNLLDSHDTNRLMDRVSGNIDVFYQQLTVLYSMPGSPCIFYGTEVAMEGSFDPDCRRCMPWEDIDSGTYDDRIGELKKLIGLRRTEPAMRSRNFHFPNEISDPRVIEYLKITENTTLKVVLNCSKEEVYLTIKEQDVLYSRLFGNDGKTDDLCSVEDGGCKTLRPGGILIYKV